MIIEHKPFDMELFLSICEKYGLSKEDIFKDENEVMESIDIAIPSNATNMDILKTMFSDIQWDNECNGVIYGYKTNDRMMPILGADFNWLNAPYEVKE